MIHRRNARVGVVGGAARRPWLINRATPPSAAVVAALLVAASVIMPGADPVSAEASPCSGGAVLAWGRNTDRQLGDGTTQSRTTAVRPVGVPENVAEVAAGGAHSLAVTADGTVFSWGYNVSQQLGWRTDSVGPGIDGLGAGSGVVLVAAGDSFSLAIRSGGAVVGWGDNSSGQLGKRSAPLPANPLLAPVDGLPAVGAVAGGSGHTLALAAVGGQVWALGANGSGQLGNDATVSSADPVQVSGMDGVVAIAAGTNHSLALRGGQVWAWGSNESGQLGSGSVIEGAVVPTSSRVPVAVAGLPPIVAVAAGHLHSLAVDNAGTVWAWGSSDAFGWGVADPNTGFGPSPNPSKVEGVSGAVAVAAGRHSSLARKADGTVVAWGYNGHGGLAGNSPPAPVPGFEGAVKLSHGATGEHALAVSISASSGAGAVVACAGQLQATTVGETFPSALEVIVRGARGQPAAGVEVTFTAPDSGASAVFANGEAVMTSTTDADGTARVEARANTRVGTYTVAAAATGFSAAMFSLRNDAAAPAAVTPMLGTTPQTRIVGSGRFPVQPLATVSDPFGNGVPGVSVTFTVPAPTTEAPASGVFSDRSLSATFMTDANGVANRNLLGASAPPEFVPNDQVGTYTITATVEGMAADPAEFVFTHVLATAALEAVAGVAQSRIVATAYEPLVVKAVDERNKPAPDLAVTFAAPATGASATFAGGTRTVTVRTDASGLATSPVPSANNAVGVFQVVATADGYGAATFTLTNQAGRAPTIAAVTPALGSQFGGTEVVISGDGLEAVTEVRFDSKAATSVRFQAGHGLLVVIPEHAPGEVDVTVASRFGADAVTHGFTYHEGTGWIDADPMETARWGHTASRLPDNTVVLAGGRAPGVAGVVGPTPTAEAYVPGANDGRGGWLHLPPMAEARAGHTATVLEDPTCLAASPPSCKILVTGGQSLDGTFLNSTELFDPVERRWAASTEHMATARSGHTATLLRNGKVLVAGGQFGSTSSVTDTAEVYDPVADTWTTVGAVMTVPRTGHTATRLGDGTVLLVGGIGGGGLPSTSASADVFHPATGSFTAANGMADARTGHSATLLGDGAVLVTGGAGLVTAALSSAEVYRAGRWSRVGAMASPRDGHTATVVSTGASTTVMVAGGRDGTVPAVAAVEVFDSATGGFRTAPSMRTARAGHTANAVGNGTILVAGGRDQFGRALASAEIYQLNRPALRVDTIDPPSGPPAGGTRVTITGAGLFHPDTKVAFGDVAATLELVRSNRIVAVAPAHAPGVVVVTVRAGGAAIVAGSFSYELGVWRPTVEGMTAYRSDHTASLLGDGTILVAGGMDPRDPPGIFPALTSAERYHPSRGTWERTGAMSTPRRGHTATVLDGPACRGDSPPGYCGKVLVAGGSVRSPAPGVPTFIRGTAEMYDPKSGEWQTSATPMTTPRYAHTATLLDGPACRAAPYPGYCGKVLVTGGIYNFQATDSTLRSAELYDPAKDEWVAVASMNVNHVHHRATLFTPAPGVGDKVLVVGGSVPGDSTSDNEPTAELYDPEAGTWELAPEPPYARFSHSATTLAEPAKVLVAGGRNADSAELYGGGQWAPTGPMRVPTRAGHSDTLLPGGAVLVAGGVAVKPDGTVTPPLASTEVYDSKVGPNGGWSYASPMTFARGYRPPNDAAGRFNLDNVLDAHTATLLDVSACHVATSGPPPTWCGSVMVAGGSADTPRADLFTPPPSIASVSPVQGPTAEGTTVTIDGFGLASATEVRFGDVAVTPRVLSATRITAIAPPRAAGRVEVSVRSAGGSSLEPASFTYAASRPPGRVTDLVARAVSASEIELGFSAPASDGAFPPPATRYVIKQSRSNIHDDAAFDAAASLCTPECTFGPATVGERLSLQLSGVAAGTTYHFALRALSDTGTGPLSNPASATTPAVLRFVPGVPVEPVPDLEVSLPGTDPVQEPASAARPLAPRARGPAARALRSPAPLSAPVVAAVPATATPVPATPVLEENVAPPTSRPPLDPEQLGLPKTPSDGGGRPGWLLALAAVVTVGLAALGAYLNRRLRS